MQTPAVFQTEDQNMSLKIHILYTVWIIPEENQVPCCYYYVILLFVQGITAYSQVNISNFTIQFYSDSLISGL